MKKKRTTCNCNVPFLLLENQNTCINKNILRKEKYTKYNKIRIYLLSRFLC